MNSNTYEELKYITANPFKRKGKKQLEKNRFIFSLSIDLNWFETSEAKKIMQTAIEKNLLKEEEEQVNANFDLNQIELKLNYEPDKQILQKLKNIKKPNEKKEITKKLKKNNLTEKEIQKQTQKTTKQMHNYIDNETAALIIARENEINIEKEIQEKLRKLLKQKNK